MKPLRGDHLDKWKSIVRDPRAPILGIFTLSPQLSSLLLITSVAPDVPKSHDHPDTQQELLSAPMPVPTLCNVVLALWLPVGASSAVSVAEQVCVITRAGSPGWRDKLGSTSTSQGWGRWRRNGSGCHLLDVQPFVCG